MGDFNYRHHVEPRVKLYMPKEESFPIPLKYIDLTWTTDTALDVNWRFLERWWRWRIVGCKDRFHKIHCAEWETTGWQNLVREETRKPTNQRESVLEDSYTKLNHYHKFLLMFRSMKVQDAKAEEWFLVHFRQFYSPSSRRTQSQSVRAERRIIPYSTEVHQRSQNNIYIDGRNFGKQIEDYWNVDGEKRIVRCTDRIRKICSTKERRPDLWKFMSDAAKKKAKQR